MTDLQNAICALDSFRSELMRGDAESARPIRGLELFDQDTVTRALHTIRAMPVPESCEDIRWLTVNTLYRVVQARHANQLVA